VQHRRPESHPAMNSGRNLLNSCPGTSFLPVSTTANPTTAKIVAGGFIPAAIIQIGSGGFEFFGFFNAFLHETYLLFKFNNQIYKFKLKKCRGLWGRLSRRSEDGVGQWTRAGPWERLDRDVPTDESSYPLTPKFPFGGWRTESAEKLYPSRRLSITE